MRDVIVTNLFGASRMPYGRYSTPRKHILPGRTSSPGGPPGSEWNQNGQVANRNTEAGWQNPRNAQPASQL